MIADRPILFSGPMVRALLAGTKTQTRRVISTSPKRSRINLFDGSWTDSYVLDPGNQSWLEEAYPWRVGDRLYVREAWQTEAAYDDLSPAQMGGEEPVRYDSDGSHQTWGYPAISRIGRFRQGMHMPRWASRLTLVVTDVHVQRLQDISDRDAWAEGVKPPVEEMSLPDAAALCERYGTDHAGVASYAKLWDSLNAERGYGWDMNPWVVAVSFSVHRGNIDQMAEVA